MEWEYNRHVQYPGPLIINSQDLLDALKDGTIDIYQALMDTRPVHKHLFKDLVEYGLEQFAGHYRGEDYPYLKHYQVCLAGSPVKCCPAQHVLTVMQEFQVSLSSKIIDLDNQCKKLSSEEKLIEAAKLACAASVKFCQIHPYANGNGHISRFMILAILKKYGHTVTQLPIDPRPSDITYISSIQEYSNGNKSPLLFWLLSLVDPD